VIDNNDLVTTEDPEIRTCLRRLLETQGVNIHEWAGVTGAGREGNRKWLTFTVDGRENRVLANEILVATGRAPAVDDLALKVPGVDVSDQGS
jgi:pyruvate/2-oxoglutarate dehydrogenase complex dihydrolipoamide dehydrogenase (E3) component